MINRLFKAILLTMSAFVLLNAPAFAQFYVNPYANPYYGNPYYNNYGYRGYAPYGYYGYRRHQALKNALIGAGIGAGIGAAIGLLSSHHGHRHWYW